jgi:hypothetical protein
MPRECTWITARVEARSEGGCTSYIQILGATAIDDQLASEEVVWTCFLRVGFRIGLQGVTVESIFSGEIGTRHWTGEQGAAAVAGFSIVRPVRAKVSPGPDDNFRGKQTKDCLGLRQQSHGRKDCRALQSSSAHCARRFYNTNMITYKQTRPSAHYQASSIHNCSSSASVCFVCFIHTVFTLIRV